MSDTYWSGVADVAFAVGRAQGCSESALDCLHQIRHTAHLEKNFLRRAKGVLRSVRRMLGYGTIAIMGDAFMLAPEDNPQRPSIDYHHLQTFLSAAKKEAQALAQEISCLEAPSSVKEALKPIERACTTICDLADRALHPIENVAEIA